MKSSREIDFCKGPLFRQTLVFTFPLLVSGFLQLSFNAADMAVIGRFGSVESLGAVGATTSLCYFLLTIAVGLSVGVNVVVAQSIGAKDNERTGTAVHTSMLLALICGAALLVAGLFTATRLLDLMRVPADVFERSRLYLTIFILGIPGTIFYNFGGAVLRSTGDTRRPLLYLVISGVANVLLNLLFVIRFRLDVAGVAWATVLSQLLAAALVGRALHGEKGAIRLVFRKLRIDRGHLLNLLRIGLPAGGQSACFSISNMIIQSAVNTLGTLVVAGNTASSTLEGFVYFIGGAFSQAAVSIVGQNFGGNKPGRIVRSVRLCTASSAVAMLAAGALMIRYGRSCLGFFTSNPEAAAWGFKRMAVMLPVNFIGAAMDIYSSALRGIGRSMAPTAITFFFVILMRIAWVFCVFPVWPSLTCLMLSYPITWTLATAGDVWVFRRAMRDIFGTDVTSRRLQRDDDGGDDGDGAGRAALREPTGDVEA